MAPSLSFTYDTNLTSVVSGLVPVVGMVFLGFLSVSVPLAALAIELRDRLGYGPTPSAGLSSCKPWQPC